MDKIMTETGYLLSYGLEKLNNRKVLQPFLVSIYPNGEQKRESFHCLSYEVSIPKIINHLHANNYDAECGIAIYPAEIEEHGKRKPVVIAMLEVYSQHYNLTIAQHYEKRNGIIIPTLYELLDFSASLIHSLRDLEKAFLNGAKRLSCKANKSLNSMRAIQ